MEVWPVTSWLPPFQVFFSRGVLRAHSEFGNAGEGQNTFAPRFGFAWQFLPKTSRFVLRGGYGTYYSRPTGQAFYQNVFGATFSLNVQAELHHGWLLETGYVGTRGTHLVRQRSLNQALPASTNDPIRGVTTNTFADIPLRVPILGVPPGSLQEMESEGSSWYNGLEMSLTKRLSHHFQFLASSLSPRRGTRTAPTLTHHRQEM